MKFTKMIKKHPGDSDEVTTTVVNNLFRVLMGSLETRDHMVQMEDM